MHTPRSLMLISALGVGCTHPTTTPTLVAAQPCGVSGVGSTDAPWRQVRASGFTFCVPTSWRPSSPGKDSLDASVWSGGRGSVTWGLGRPASMIAADVKYTISGSIVTGAGATPPPRPLPPTSPCSQEARTPYLIGSVVVVVTQIECQGIWTITAWSTTPAMYVQGEARSAREAELLKSVMQTIRFTAVPH